MERVLAESMPIVATGKFDLLYMVVLLRLVAQSEHHTLEGREHGRTITLAEVRDRMWERQGCAVSGRFGALPTNRKRPPTGRVSSAVDAATAAVVDPRHPIRQEVDQLDQKLDQHREESAKLDILPLGRSNR